MTLSKDLEGEDDEDEGDEVEDLRETYGGGIDSIDGDGYGGGGELENEYYFDASSTDRYLLIAFLFLYFFSSSFE